MRFDQGSSNKNISKGMTPTFSRSHLGLWLAYNFSLLWGKGFSMNLDHKRLLECSQWALGNFLSTLSGLRSSIMSRRSAVYGGVGDQSQILMLARKYLTNGTVYEPLNRLLCYLPCRLSGEHSQWAALGLCLCKTLSICGRKMTGSSRWVMYIGYKVMKTS